MLKQSIRLVLVVAILSIATMPLMAGEGCSTEKKHGSCPVEGAKTVSTEEVELTGKLLCRHCNLHEQDSCEKVFVSDADERYVLCPAGEVKAAEKIAEHGEATLVVEGTVITLADGTRVLRISSAATRS